MPARRFVIRGVVQGVGFRYSMCEEATRLGLCGWVRNRRDGSVEAVARGDAAALDALQRWASHGPRGARVDAVDTTPLADEAAAVEPGTGRIEKTGRIESDFRQMPTV